MASATRPWQIPLLLNLPDMIRDIAAKSPTLEQAGISVLESNITIGELPSIHIGTLERKLIAQFQGDETFQIDLGSMGRLGLEENEQETVLVHTPLNGVTPTTYVVHYIRFYHPDAAVRLAALQEGIRQVSPFHPDVLGWSKRLTHAAFREGDLDEYLAAFIDSPKHRWAQTQETLRTKSFNLADLIPRQLPYFERLIGGISQTANESDYSKVVFVEFAKNCLAQNTKDGLRVLLYFGFDKTLMDQVFELVRSESGVSRIMLELEVVVDPFSVLALFDLATRFSENDAANQDLASRLFGRLLEGELKMSNGKDAYACFSTLAPFVHSCILVSVPTIGSVPHFWTRVAAWVHTGVLIHLLNNWGFDLVNWQYGIDQCRNLEADAAELLDLLACPLALRHVRPHLAIDAMIVGELRSRQATIPSSLLTALQFDLRLADRFAKLTQDSKSLNIFTPGPLEFTSSIVRVRTGIQFEDEFATKLAERIREADSKVPSEFWRLLRTLLPGVSVSDDQLTNFASGLQASPIPLGEDIRQAWDDLAQAAFVAAVHGNNNLANATQALSLKFWSEKESPDLIYAPLMVAVFAASVNKDPGGGIRKFGEYLRDLAWNTKDSTSISTLMQLILHFKRYSAIEYWNYSEAEALLMTA